MPELRPPDQSRRNVCPHCSSVSDAVDSSRWLLVVQAQTSDRWQWLDEKANIFRWYPEGTPSNPSATTDQTPSRALDPAVISPPGTEPPIPIERQGAVRPSRAQNWNGSPTCMLAAF